MSSRIFGPAIATLVFVLSNQQSPPATRPSTYRNDAWRFTIVPPEFKAEFSEVMTWITEFTGAPAKNEDEAHVQIGVFKGTLEAVVRQRESTLALIGCKFSQYKDLHVGKHVGREFIGKWELGGRRSTEIDLFVNRGELVFLVVARTSASRFDELEATMRKSLSSFSVEE